MPYRLDVFMAERFKYQSVFLFQASGVSFVQPWQQTQAVDYLATVPESLHVGALVQDFRIGDEFTTGPYNVTVGSIHDLNYMKVCMMQNNIIINFVQTPRIFIFVIISVLYMMFSSENYLYDSVTSMIPVFLFL